LLHREMLLEVGLLDEGYFMYFEDVDLCFRAMSAGWKLVVAGDTSVLHREGGSARKANNVQRDRIVTASGFRFLSRHGRPAKIAMMLYVGSRLGKRLLRLNFGGMKAVLLGIQDWVRE
jgi:GT2 family glycosyltransferase